MKSEFSEDCKTIFCFSAKRDLEARSHIVYVRSENLTRDRTKITRLFDESIDDSL